MLIRVAIFNAIAILCTGEVAAQTAQTWPLELRVGRYSVHSDYCLLDQKRLISELEQMSVDMNNLLQVRQTQQPIHIVLFETELEYERYMRNYFPALPYRRAMFIQDRGPGMLFTHWHAEIATDLRHEVAHALLNADGCRLPLWLDEGIAEYFEVEQQCRFSNSAYLPSVARRARSGFVPSLEQLESIERLEHFSNASYRDSWSWVHFMLHRSKTTRNLLLRHLQDLQSGVQPLPISRQLTAALPDIDTAFAEHFENVLKR